MVTVEFIKEGESPAERSLRILRGKMPDIDRRLRVAFATEIVGDIQKNYLRGQVLHRVSGDLASHTAHKDASQNETMIGVYGVIYARIHELGGTIVPKNGKYLTFPSKRFATRFSKGGKLMKGGKYRREVGGWVSVRSVTIPKRPYLLPGIVNYFKGGQSELTAETFLQRELDKIERA